MPNRKGVVVGKGPVSDNGGNSGLDLPSACRPITAGKTAIDALDDMLQIWVIMTKFFQHERLQVLMISVSSSPHAHGRPSAYHLHLFERFRECLQRLGSLDCMYIQTFGSPKRLGVGRRDILPTGEPYHMMLCVTGRVRKTATRLSFYLQQLLKIWIVLQQRRRDHEAESAHP